MFSFDLKLACYGGPSVYPRVYELVQGNQSTWASTDDPDFLHFHVYLLKGQANRCISLPSRNATRFMETLQQSTFIGITPVIKTSPIFSTAAVIYCGGGYLAAVEKAAAPNGEIQLRVRATVGEANYPKRKAYLGKMLYLLTTARQRCEWDIILTTVPYYADSLSRSEPFCSYTEQGR